MKTLKITFYHSDRRYPCSDQFPNLFRWSVSFETSFGQTEKNTIKTIFISMKKTIKTMIITIENN